MRRVALHVLTALLLASCARDAVLEIELTVPPQPGTMPQRYAVVQFERDATPFEAEWSGGDQPPGVPLAASTQALAYSVQTEHPGPLRIKVRFCLEPDCSCDPHVEDCTRIPGVWYELPQAFYIGQRTRWHATIDAPAGMLPPPPTTAIQIDKCHIAGCIDATSTDTTYCRMDMTHFCE